MHRRSAQLVLTAVLLLAGSFTARAQNGQVSGRITDPQGAAVPNLTVQVINQADNSKKEVQTNESGSFAVSNLLPGAYRLVIEPQGFSPVSKEFTIALGQAAVLNVQLEVESVKTSVNVKGGVAAEVKTESAELTGIVTSTELVSLGLNGRNFTQLIALTPGVSNQTGQDEGKVGVLGSAKYSVNGGRVEYNNFDVDGSDVLNAGLNGAWLDVLLLTVQLLPRFFGERGKCAPAINAKDAFHHAACAGQVLRRVGQPSEPCAPLSERVIVPEELLLQRRNRILRRAARHLAEEKLDCRGSLRLVHALPQVLVEPRNVNPHRAVGHAARAGRAELAETRIGQRARSRFP